MKAYLNNIPVEFANQDDISFDFVAADGNPNGVLLNDIVLELKKLDFDVSGDGVKFVANWIDQFGLSKLIPAKVIHPELGVVFDGLGNLGSKNTKLGSDFVDLFLDTYETNFFDRAASLNLRLFYFNFDLTSSYRLESTDYKNARYTLENVPAYIESAILAYALYSVIREIVTLIKFLADSANPLNPNEIISTALYFATMAVQIAILLDGISDAIFQKPFYYKVVKVLPLLRKACAFLGFEFKSQLLEAAPFANDFVLLGETDSEGGIVNRPQKKPTNIPVPDITLRALFSSLETMFNGELKVKGASVVFEPKVEFYKSPSNFIISKMNGDNSYSYNMDELAESYSLRFSDDPFDMQTKGKFIDEDDAAQLSEREKLLSVVSMFNPDGGLLPPRREPKVLDIGFARGARKKRTRTIERAINSIYDLFYTVFSGGSPLSGDRTNYMLLEKHTVGVNKMLFVGDDGLLTNDNKNILNTDHLFDTYHFDTTINGEYGRWTIIEGISPQPICSELLLNQVRENNICLDWAGRTAIIEEHVFDESTKLHAFKIRVAGWVNPICGDETQIPFTPLNEQKTNE